MTAKLLETLTLAEEALDKLNSVYGLQETPCVEKALSAIREQKGALVEQEPVVWSQKRKRNLIKHWAFDCDWSDLTEREIDDLELIVNAVLNAAPVRTKDLTDVEVEKVWRKHGGYMVMPIDFARAAIAADREKNT